MDDHLYLYRARVINVVDGDTLDVEVDLGFRIQFTMRVRLAGINAPELHGDHKEQGLASKVALTNMALGRTCIIKTIKDSTEKYGRYLANVFVGDLDVNAEMLARGFATEYNPQ